jgi:hypothetical protein
MLNLHVTILEGKPIRSNPGKELKRRAHDLKNEDASQAKAGSNSRILFASNESILIPRNLDPGPI